MSETNVLKIALARGRILQQAMLHMSPTSPGTPLGPALVQEPISPVSMGSCVCNRPLQNILCGSCGNIFVGRIRKRCFQHPQSIHLMDHGSCPQCGTSYLQEFGVCLNPPNSPTQASSDKNVEIDDSFAATRKEMEQSKVAVDMRRLTNLHDNYEDMQLNKNRYA